MLSFSNSQPSISSYVPKNPPWPITMAPHPATTCPMRPIKEARTNTVTTTGIIHWGGVVMTAPVRTALPLSSMQG